MTGKEPLPSTAATDGEPRAEAQAQGAPKARRGRQAAEPGASRTSASKDQAKPKSKPKRKVAPAKAPTRGKAKAKGARKAAAPKPRPPKRSPEEIAAAWAAQLEAERPGLVRWVLDGLNGYYGRPVWERRQDPTSELVLTILSQNSADINAEVAFEALRRSYPSQTLPDDLDSLPVRSFPGWGGEGLRDLPPPDWERVENAPIPELTDVIRPGGLANQKAPRLQASLAAVRGAAGGYSLEFLGEMPALDARRWMTQIPGIGPKTASVVLLFSFGTPLMPVDRHVERVAQRVGLLPPKADANQAHDIFLALLEPDQMYEAHVGMIRHGRQICHARNPECLRCPLAERCRYFRSEAP